MNRYLFFRRIRGPIFLLTFGVTALLNEWDILGFSRSWPLYLIVAGVLRLAEGAFFSAAFAGSQPFYGAMPGAPYAPPAASGTALTTVAPAPLESTGYQPVPGEER